MTEYNNEAKTDDADVEQYNTLNTRARTYEIKFNQKQTHQKHHQEKRFLVMY